MNCCIQGINGPVVTVRGGRSLAMMDLVKVGDDGLLGEVVGLEGDTATVQVYEDTDVYKRQEGAYGIHRPCQTHRGR